MHAIKTHKSAFKTLIAAEYSGIDVKFADDFEMGVSNKTPEFLKMNPIGKVHAYIMTLMKEVLIYIYIYYFLNFEKKVHVIFLGPRIGNT